MSDPGYERSPDVLWRNVGSEILLTRPNVDTTDVLSETAAQVWMLLEVPGTALEISERLDGFAGRADEIAGGVRALLADLVRRGHCARTDG